jgi:hypothetical protein
VQGGKTPEYVDISGAWQRSNGQNGSNPCGRQKGFAFDAIKLEKRRVGFCRKAHDMKEQALAQQEKSYISSLMERGRPACPARCAGQPKRVAYISSVIEVQAPSADSNSS